MISAKAKFSFVFLFLFAVLSCSKNNLSERDAKREQLRTNAETKRTELSVVAGDYRGILSEPGGMDQNASLKLEIKDIPTPVEGGVDPVMVPTLTGYLRFNLGSSGESSEYIGFSITKADYNPKEEKLDLVVTNDSYKDILISAYLSDSGLDGTWTAPASAKSGSLKLQKTALNSGGTLSEQMSGEYTGVLSHDSKSLYQFGVITLSTSIKPPEGLKVVAVVRLIFGEWNSTEYLTYKFDPVEFNPMTGQIIFKSENADILFSGHWSSQGLTGEWSSTYTGRLGKASFKKSPSTPTLPGTTFESLKGSYQGKLTNTNPQSNLPEKMMVSFVTSQDVSKPNGISISGSMRLYIGPFGSNEYIEYPFSDVQFNFFTRVLTAKVTGQYQFTLKATADQKVISGTLWADSLGEVGKYEVTKQ